MVHGVKNERGHKGKNRRAVSPQPILHVDILDLGKSIQIAPNFPPREMETINIIRNIKAFLQSGFKNSLIIFLFIIMNYTLHLNKFLKAKYLSNMLLNV